MRIKTLNDVESFSKISYLINMGIAGDHNEPLLFL